MRNQLNLYIFDVDWIAVALRHCDSSRSQPIATLSSASAPVRSADAALQVSHLIRRSTLNIDVALQQQQQQP